MPLQPADSQQLQLLVRSHAQTRASVAQTAALAAQQDVRTFSRWYDTAAIAEFTQRLAQRSQSSQRLTASLTDAYLARVLTILRGRPVRAAGVTKLQGLRTGVTPAGVYGRLADTYRWEVERGADDAPALLERLDLRVQQLTTTDNDLAFRAQVRSSLGKHQVETFRRVLHPELAMSGQSCGLCIAASNRIYKTRELLPLHGNCHCGVLPIEHGEDPGHDLNASDLAALYKLAGSTGRQDLAKVRIAFHDHGELGPVLRDEADKFLGKAGAKARGSATGERQALTRAQIDFQIRTLTEQQTKPGLSDFARQWQADRLAALARQRLTAA